MNFSLFMVRFHHKVDLDIKVYGMTGTANYFTDLGGSHFFQEDGHTGSYNTIETEWL